MRRRNLEWDDLRGLTALEANKPNPIFSLVLGSLSLSESVCFPQYQTICFAVLVLLVCGFVGLPIRFGFSRPVSSLSAFYFKVLSLMACNVFGQLLSQFPINSGFLN